MLKKPVSHGDLRENKPVDNKNMKKWIDTSSYRGLLFVWRFHKSGDPLFQGEMGDYYAKVMAKKKKKVGHDEHVRISKDIGWA